MISIISPVQVYGCATKKILQEILVSMERMTDFFEENVVWDFSGEEY